MLTKSTSPRLPAGGCRNGFGANLRTRSRAKLLIDLVTSSRHSGVAACSTHGGEDDEDEGDFWSRKRAKRTSGGGAWRAYGREATDGQKGIPDLKVAGQHYNKLSNEEMAWLQVLGFCGTMAHKDDPHKKAFGL